MILPKILTLTLAMSFLVATFSEASNSAVIIKNDITGSVPADRTKRSEVNTESEVCTPYQSAFPDGYCKNIIGYLPVYGETQFELYENEMNMQRFQVAKEFIENSRANATQGGGDNPFVVRQSCLDMVDNVYCHHYFKRCYISSKPPLICREACEELFFKVCDREFKIVERFMNSREGTDYPYYFDIINCTTLPFRNESSNCYYPDKIRDKLDVLESGDCFYGDGRGYRGNGSVTVSGYTCQSWDSQYPHQHTINGKIYESIENSSNFCRNPGGFAKDGPWCFTTNKTVRWEYCDVPKCPKLPPSSPPSNFRGHNITSTIIRVFWGDVAKDHIHGVLVGFHVECVRPNTSERHVADLSPAEHNWLFKGLQKYRNYSCWLRAYNNYGNGTWSKELVISTDEDVPDAPPESLKAWNLSSTTLHVQWDPIPFRYRNGKILRYQVNINSEKHARVRLKSTNYTESTSITFKGLQKYSKYEISVSGITSRGKGPATFKVVQTDEDVPERPPKEITAVSIAIDTVQIDWSPVPPEYTNGEVLGYKVLYHDVNDTSRANNSLVSREETRSRISGLKANTNYSFQVLAFTARGDGTKSMAYFARTFSGKNKNPSVVNPSIDPGEAQRAKVSIIVAAVFSGIVVLGAVLLVAYFVRKKRDLTNSDNGNGLGCSVTPYAISSPDWINEIICTHRRHEYETLDDDNVPAINRRPIYVNVAADGSLDLPPYLRNIVNEFEQLYDNTRYRMLQPRVRRRSVGGAVDGDGNPMYDSLLRGILSTATCHGNGCSQGVLASSSAKMEHGQHHSVDLGELRGFVGALQGNAVAEVEAVGKRCRRRFSVDMGEVREFIALREMTISTKEERSTLTDQPEAEEARNNFATC